MFLILLYYWSFYNRLWNICYNYVVMLFAVCFFLGIDERAVISNGEFSLYLVLRLCCRIGCSYQNAFLSIIALNTRSQIVFLKWWNFSSILITLRWKACSTWMKLFEVIPDRCLYVVYFLLCFIRNSNANKNIGF